MDAGKTIRDYLRRRELARQLRRLARPITPPGLKQQLLAGIPAKASRLETPTAEPIAVLRRLAMTGAAAAVVLVAAALYLLVNITGDKPNAPQVEPAILNDTRPSCVLGQTTDRAKETRPCDVLPPVQF
jgi:hypothetical protein